MKETWWGMNALNYNLTSKKDSKYFLMCNSLFTKKTKQPVFMKMHLIIKILLSTNFSIWMNVVKYTNTQLSAHIETLSALFWILFIF